MSLPALGASSPRWCSFDLPALDTFFDRKRKMVMSKSYIVGLSAVLNPGTVLRAVMSNIHEVVRSFERIKFCHQQLLTPF